MPSLPAFVLASASPARRRLLQSAGIEAIVRPSDFDESQVQSRNAADLVQILAQGKAAAVATTLQNSLILGCDSVLAFNG